jgi:hypothetical protein
MRPPSRRHPASDYHVLRVRADTIEIMLKMGVTVEQYAQDVLGVNYKTLERALGLKAMINCGALAAPPMSESALLTLHEAAHMLGEWQRYKIRRGVTERRLLRGHAQYQATRFHWAQLGEDKVSLLGWCQERGRNASTRHGIRVVDVVGAYKRLESRALPKGTWLEPLTQTNADRLVDDGFDVSDRDVREALAVYVDRVRSRFLARAPAVLRAFRRTLHARLGRVRQQTANAERDRLEWLLDYYREPKRVQLTLRNLATDVQRRSHRSLSAGESALLFELCLPFRDTTPLLAAEWATRVASRRRTSKP